MSFTVIANWKDSGDKLSVSQASHYKSCKKLEYIICPNGSLIKDLPREHLSFCMQKLKSENTLLSKYKYVLCNHADHITENYDAKTIIREIYNSGLTPIIFVKNYSEAVELVNVSDKGIIVFESHEFIGKACSMNLEDVKKEINKIKNITEKKVCYGGSLNEENYKDFTPYVDGLCFGRLSRSSIFNDVLKNLSVSI